jgi:hypothetical protein
MLQVASAGSVFNVCSNRAHPVEDMLRTLLSFSPIGSSIVLQPQPGRFRSFDEKILLVGKLAAFVVRMHVHAFAGR